MRRKLCAIAAAVIALSGTFDRPEGPYYGLHYTWTVLADGTSWWKHVEFLADDSLQGRETGSPGHRRAAEYVVSEFRKSGLEPAGTNGFIQTVAFTTRRIDEARSSLSLARDGRTIPLTLGEHANFRMAVAPAPAVELRGLAKIWPPLSA